MATAITKEKKRLRDRRIVACAVFACVAVAAVTFASVRGPAWLAVLKYDPQEGDIVFQSLPRNALVDVIEAVTESSYSHCGIVDFLDGEWVVHEAYDRVETTPLATFLDRGRNDGFAVYRLKQEFREAVPRILESTQPMLGRQYDAWYRMDDRRIYCSELIFKAYRSATGEELGTLVRIGDLRWKPFEETIVQLAEGPVPVGRVVITPKHIALAPQLELVMSFNIAEPTSANTN